MTGALFTIGFASKTAEEFFRLLEEAGVRRVIDIRENRIGQLQGFAKFPDLVYFLDRLAGIDYVYEPLLAPSPEIRKAYRKTRDWKQYEESFKKLMEQRKVLEHLNPDQFEGNVALLCSEPEPDKCHRRLVAEMLAQHWNETGHHVEIRHLVLPKRSGGKKRRRATYGGVDPV